MNECGGELASETPKAKRRKKTTQHTYDPKTWADIGKNASLHWLQATVKHFLSPVDTISCKKIKEGVLIRGEEAGISGSCSVSLSTKPRGRPLMLGELDQLVQRYIKQVRSATSLKAAGILDILNMC